MAQSSRPSIHLKGVRQNNLKNFDLDLPTSALIVVTGLSGSGKSSLAFDTLYAEGQRRYIETFSPYARQFFERMDKPQVDSIQGIPPAIAIEQRNAVRSTRSTVGTMTEICDYMKVVWAHLAQLYCRNCGKPVRKDSPQQIWQQLHQDARAREEILVTFQIALSDKLSLDESLNLVAKQGYQRLLLGTAQPEGRSASHGGGVPGDAARGAAFEVVRLDEARTRLAALKPGAITVIQDRLTAETTNRRRFIEACEQAYHFGKGKLAIYYPRDWIERRYSNRLHCAECDLEYREPSPALFSFNHPVGACPTCRGFGRTITIDYDLALPDRSLTLAQGVVKPWQSGQSAECQDDLIKFCRKRTVPMDVPFDQLAPQWQRWVIDGDPDYGKDSKHQWPHVWYGVKGYFRWLESKAYKMHVRVLLSRYRAYRTCPDCQGKRFQPETLLFKYAAQSGGLLTLADFYALPVHQALEFVQAAVKQRPTAGRSDPLRLVLSEALARLQYLDEVGLSYLTLDRPTRSLSGGETERVNLTTCLGSRLVNTLFVLDEPSVGLHPRDTKRLVRILQHLRNAGNTVLVVEHEPDIMRAADQIVDLGPGHGEAGGSVVFQGTYQEILKSAASLTGRYLSRAARIQIPPRRPIHGGKDKKLCPILTLTRACRHNLKDLTVDIPLQRLVCITGVSGSGKTTLVRDVLLPRLDSKLPKDQTRKSSAAKRIDDTPSSQTEAPQDDEPGAAATAGTERGSIQGWESLGRVVLVDQSLLGKTPRSNPAVYIGAFDAIRDLFARSEAARQRGLNASAFSFNSSQGQCELCRGAGFEKIEMQFLSDVFIRCPACHGRRYREHILEVTLAPGTPPGDGSRGARQRSKRGSSAVRGQSNAWSIADLLDATVDQGIGFLNTFSGSRPAAQAVQRLQLLQDVGLGYLRLGQPINTLSGGESQRLKLVSHLAEFAADEARERKPTLFLFDEPTTGLHFDDVRILLAVFQRLVDQGHSVVIIEHNLELIKCADWIIDLGPEAGDGGGQLVAQGTPEQIVACSASHTGQSLREVLS